MQIIATQNFLLSFKADIKKLFDKGLLPQVKKGFYGKPLTKMNVTREHLLPHSKGGTRSESNIVLADKILNNSRGSRPIEQFAKKESILQYLEQFKDINVPNFNGKRYIKNILKTLKRLGVDLTEEASNRGLITDRKNIDKMA